MKCFLTGNIITGSISHPTTHTSPLNHQSSEVTLRQCPHKNKEEDWRSMAKHYNKGEGEKACVVWQWLYSFRKLSYEVIPKAYNIDIRQYNNKCTCTQYLLLKFTCTCTRATAHYKQKWSKPVLGGCTEMSQSSCVCCSHVSLRCL